MIGKLKPFFSEKTNFSEKIAIIERDKIFTKDAKNAENFNSIFSNAINPFMHNVVKWPNIL